MEGLAEERNTVVEAAIVHFPHLEAAVVAEETAAAEEATEVAVVAEHAIDVVETRPPSAPMRQQKQLLKLRKVAQLLER